MDQKLAILGGEKVKNTPFPDWPQYDQHERGALLEVLESRTWWRTPGSKTLGFEADFAAYHQARFGIAVTNGTAALEIALAAAKATGLPWKEVNGWDFWKFLDPASRNLLKIGTLRK